MTAERLAWAEQGAALNQHRFATGLAGGDIRSVCDSGSIVFICRKIIDLNENHCWIQVKIETSVTF